MLRPLQFGLLLLALLALVGPAPAVAKGDGPSVVDLTTALDGRRVLVSLGLSGAWDEATRERLEAGLPTGFTFEIELLRDRKHWWDDGLVECRVEVVAMYNALTREYLVNTKQDGKLVDSRTVREAQDLARSLTRLSAVPAFVVPEAVLGQRLLVRARALLGSSTWLGFFPTSDETSWTESRKFRVPVEQP